MLNDDLTIYHNPEPAARAVRRLRCSRAANPAAHRRVPEGAADGGELVGASSRGSASGRSPSCRKSENIYKTKYAGKTLTDAQWIDAMVKDPILIERPIVVRGSKAVIWLSCGECSAPAAGVKRRNAPVDDFEASPRMTGQDPIITLATHGDAAAVRALRRSPGCRHRTSFPRGPNSSSRDRGGELWPSARFNRSARAGLLRR